jgi:hypothetical protein
VKVRLITATVLASGLALSMSGAQAATPTLDGKKVKVLSFTPNGGAQDNDKDQASLTTPDRLACEMPRCAKLTFVYKPAKGVKGDLMFTATWTNPASDIDVYVGEVAKDGSASDVGHCGGAATTTEKVFIPASDLKSGKKYVMVVDFYRSVNETVNAKVEIAVPNTIKSTVPSNVDSTLYPVNCTL